MRTTQTTVTFERAFALKAVDRLQPAGTYRLVTEEEELDGLSFTAFRRTATLLHLPAMSSTGGSYRVVPVDPGEIAAALATDTSAPQGG